MRDFCARLRAELNGPIMLKLKLYDVYNNTRVKKNIFFDDLIFEICGGHRCGHHGRSVSK